MLKIESIEKGIPLPEAPGSGSRNEKVRAMRPGDSFFVVGKTNRDIASWRGYWAKIGIRFDVRRVDGGVRVWCRTNSLISQSTAS